MNLADLSIKRPVFITCVTFLVLVIGLVSMSKLGVDLFPDVTFPVVTVTTPYRGAGPAEIETLVSKPLEDEMSSLPGIKRLSSINQDGVSVVVAEFNLDTDIKFAEQQVRDRVGSARKNLPNDIEEPVIKRIDPSDQPVIIVGISSALSDGELYDLANETIKPKIEQVNQVGLVEIVGGRKREIHVSLDRKKLKSFEVSASQVASRISASGENIPAGKIEESRDETIFRTMAEFKTIKDIESVIVNFLGNDVPVTVSQLGQVSDTLVDKKTEAYVNGKKSVFLNIYRQSGANTVKVVDGVLARVTKINDELKKSGQDAEISVIRDGAQWIRWNILDVQESIFIGILLAVIVVYFFLGSIRSTIITGLALPNSLIGAFVLIAIAGFTINVMTLLALSLSVGLLIDDAIVVRENIFRKLEEGLKPVRAALEGTGEVRLAVIATTLVVLAVFGPVGFISGVIGQFLKPFGFVICFAMIISLFDALTIAPMLSAYFAGDIHAQPTSFLGRLNARLIDGFEKVQRVIDQRYGVILERGVRRPWMVLGMAFVVFVIMMSFGRFVPKTFLPTQDAGEFNVRFDLPPGSSLQAMSEVSRKIDDTIRLNPEVMVTAMKVGNKDGEANQSEIYVQLVPAKKRNQNTSEVKDKIRAALRPYAFANVRVVDFDGVGAGLRPFNINIVGHDQKLLEEYATKIFDRLKTDNRLKDVNLDYRPGKPELRVNLDLTKMEQLGVAPKTVGMELRTQLEGVEAAKFRQSGIEYDVRVRLQEDQRNLKQFFDRIYVPNINGSLIPLAAVSKPEATTGPAKITRLDRARYIQINADIAPGGGMGDVISDIEKWFKTDIKLPAGIGYVFVGQAENFQEMGRSMGIAFGLGILFIYLVLASLYESFIIPLTIMLALPLAVCGSIVGLFIMHESVNLFSLLGIVMLLGVASKNSILLVDHAVKKMAEGASSVDAMLDAGRKRLRPILMTTMALIAGIMPIAIGLNEASKQRTCMGVAIIGGLVSSTLLTLVVVPAAFILIEGGRSRLLKLWNRREAHAGEKHKVA